jgi:hypothetical protein
MTILTLSIAKNKGIEVGSSPGLGIAIQCHILSHGISSERRVRFMVEGKQIEETLNRSVAVSGVE